MKGNHIVTIMPTAITDEEVLIAAIHACGTRQEDGTITVEFGKVFDATVDTLEALSGTLRAAKAKKLISFKKPLMLKGVDDREVITLLVKES